MTKTTKKLFLWLAGKFLIRGMWAGVFSPAQFPPFKSLTYTFEYFSLQVR